MTSASDRPRPLYEKRALKNRINMHVRIQGRKRTWFKTPKVIHLPLGGISYQNTSSLLLISINKRDLLRMFKNFFKRA